MEKTEAARIFFALPEAQRETLRQAAFDNVVAAGNKPDTGAVLDQCFELIMDDTYLDLLGVVKCKNCGDLVESVDDDNGWCEGCIEAGCICSCCNGSGEGSYDGSTCSECGGSGDSLHPWGRKRVRDYDDSDDDRDDDRAIEMAEAAYEKRIYG